MSRMKYFTPALYVNEILHRAQDMNNLSDQEEAAVELQEEINDKKWEEGRTAYWEFVENTAPQVVRDFYKEVGSLHDAGFKIVEKGPTAAKIKFHRYGAVGRKYGEYDGEEVTLTLVYDKLTEEVVFPDFMVTDFMEFLYDEFQFENGVLSYHFFGTNGVEYSFDGIKEFRWK